MQATLPPTQTQQLYMYVDETAQLPYALEMLRAHAHRYLAFDFETTGLSPRNDRPVLLQMQGEAGPSIMVDCRRADWPAIARCFRPLFESEEILKVAHNAYFDYSFLLHHFGIRARRIFCTKLAEEVLTAGLKLEVSLGAVVYRRLGRVIDKSLQKSFLSIGNEDFTPEQLQYACTDTEVLVPLMRAQTAALREQGLVDTAALEFKTMPVLAGISLYGVKLDHDRWRAHVAKLEADRERKRQEIVEQLQPALEAYRARKYGDALPEYRKAMARYTAHNGLREAQASALREQLKAEGVPGAEVTKKVNDWRSRNPPPDKPKAPDAGEGVINLGSGEQLGGALTEMGVPVPVNNNGNFTTASDVLEELQHEYPVVADIQEERGLATLVEGFGENILAMCDAEGRLHSEFNQIVSTGRMSVRKPNFQQIPRNERGKEFRHCFVAPEGRKLVVADYSQIELRVLADVTGEPTLLSAYEEGVDLHSRTASVVFGVPLEECGSGSTYRSAAKAINFGLIYGMSAHGLSKRIGVSKKEAQGFIDRYFEALPKVLEWLEQAGHCALREGYSQTVGGRKRYYEDLGPEPPKGSPLWREFIRDRAGIERQAKNHPIQGTSADITKLALTLTQERFESAGLDAHIVMVVHDEIVVEAAEADAQRAGELLAAAMKQAAQVYLRNVPIEVEPAIDDFWNH